MECVNCTRGLDHCHGTLIVHTTEFTECTELMCEDLDSSRHLAVVDCSAVDGGCDCVSVLDEEILTQHDNVA
ncbi:hypothetical protein [Kutzneria buriramensis]|jgi:hypothetical protein|uniref:Uncharacterized protein n=1 Tax=Kutzneria buriramensis TaxID=1045776 RepID=A0A3E0I6S2_9PSEU|nr:hypothetical protein [Kutzneria buriramensis]REH54423.1 hypothetical protein BCF44_102655 [Kutzneria buriramensis]